MGRALKYASFKGVRFELEGHEDTFKRKLIKHPIALQNEAIYENLGVEDEAINVEGFLIGRDTTLSVDLLRRKLKEDTAGRLIHPYFGMIEVLCKAFTIKENFRETGKISLKFEFIELPSGARDLISKISDVVIFGENWFLDNVISPFSQVLEMARMPSYVAASIVQTVSTIHSFLTSTNGLGVVTSELASIENSSEELDRAFSDLIKSPVSLAKKIIDAILALPATESGLLLFNTLERPHLDDKSGAVTQLKISQQRAFSDLVAVTAVVRSLQSPSNLGVSLAIDICQTLLFDPSDDVLFRLSYELMGLVEKSRPPSHMIRLEDKEPSLVLAYRYRYNLESEDKLLKTNDIMDPLLIGGSLNVA